ncbi:MAG: hypothetical protein JWR42_2112 [Marmoricola sp.]|jgi:outer membrane murein-binding lipoprotein Lpp|nr:hypothetical protein [Marmoricola sp.]
MSTESVAARVARTRVPRFAEAAVERARLTVVPPRALGRTQAARTPFAVLVLGMLVAGVVGLLMFNTNMQQASFKATALQRQVSTLTAQEQSLSMELDQLRDPQTLARTAKQQLHMVAPATPAFVRLSDGRILGTPTPTTGQDAVRIMPLPAQVPAEIARRTIIVEAKPSAAARAAAKSAADTRGTSTGTTGSAGRKSGSTAATSTTATPGAPR